MPTILLDENVPRPLLRCFPEGTATTVDLLGWKGVKDAALLARMEAAGFSVLVTADRSIQFQNRLSGRRLALVVLPGNRWRLLRDRLADMVAAVEAAVPGTVTEIPPG